MASRAIVAAHDNAFNRAVLQNDAYYFSSFYEVKGIIETTTRNDQQLAMINNNLKKIREQYNWDTVVSKYERFLQRCVVEKMSRSLKSVNELTR
jgi:glycosyltransferase involved in cell wall biosynthesis